MEKFRVTANWNTVSRERGPQEARLGTVVTLDEDCWVKGYGSNLKEAVANLFWRHIEELVDVDDQRNWPE